MKSHSSVRRLQGYLNPMSWALALLLSLQVSGLASPPESTKELKVGEKIKAFELNRHPDGKTIRLADYAGKIVVLDFFAPWCVSCAQAAPILDKEVQEYYATKKGNPQGVEVELIAINVDPSDDAGLKKYFKKHKPHLVLDDPDSKYMDELGGNVLPFIVVIDGTGSKQGEVRFTVLAKHEGFPGTQTLRSVIDKVGRSDTKKVPSNK